MVTDPQGEPGVEEPQPAEKRKGADRPDMEPEPKTKGPDMPEESPKP